MNEEQIFDAIGEVDESFIEAAAQANLKKQSKVKHKKLIVAVAAVLVIGTGLYFPVSYLVGRDDTVVCDAIYPSALAFDDYNGQMDISDNSPVDEETIKATNEFAYKTTPNVISKNGKNSNYSPLSVYYALSTVASGAEGDTQSELLSLLGFSDKDKQATQCENLYKNIYFNNEIGSLKLANSIWLGKSYHGQTLSFNKEFTDNAAEKFFASSHSVDFGNRTAGEQMSRWIKSTTNGNQSPQIDTSPENILAIINTVYFHDQWCDEFEKSNTKDENFILDNGSKITASFMNSEKNGGFNRGVDFTRSSLSFKNGGQMTFILPDEGVSAQSLIATPQKMKETFEGGTQSNGIVRWKIPKFSFASSYKLEDSIKKAGVNKAFSSEADLKGITDLNNVFISSIQQGTKISIDEKGCEASSYTDIVYCGSAQPKQNADMFMTRPFVYGIYSPQGSLLFVGICENPNEH